MSHRRDRSFSCKSQETVNANSLKENNSRDCQLLKYFQGAWQSGDLCDFTIYCRSKEFKLHRLMLASKSDKFREIFRTQNPVTNLVLNYYNEDVVEAVITYLYTNQLSFKNGKEEQIKECAQELGIDEIYSANKKSLPPYNVNNVVEKFLVTKRNGIYSENRQCLRYMGEWLPDVSQTMEFLQMPVGELCDALCSEEIRQRNELEVLQAAIRWLRFDYTNRKTHARKVFSAVKFQLINPKELDIEISRNRSILDLHPGAIRVYSESESRYSDDSAYDERTENDRRVFARPCVAVVYKKSVYSVMPGEFTGGDESTNGWRLVTALPDFRSHSAVTYFNDHIYVIGGADETTKKSSRTAMKYSVDLRQWSYVAPMQEARSYASAVVLGGKIFVVGGRNEHKMVLNSMEIYDAEHDKWTYASPASGRCVGAAVTEYLHRLYRFGGDDSRQTLSLTEVYDPERDKWLLRTPLQEDSAFSGVVEARGRLYIVGGAKYRKGYKVLSSIKAYEPTQDRWTYENELQSPRCDHGIVKIGTKFYVFSGFGDLSRSIDTVECYDTLMRTTVKGTVTSSPNGGTASACIVPRYE